MNSREPSPALRIGIRPWRDDDLSLLHRLNTPAMTEHVGGPETQEEVEARHVR